MMNPEVVCHAPLNTICPASVSYQGHTKCPYAPDLPTIIIKFGDEFTIRFPNSDKEIKLTWKEWMGLRKVQNSLIHTEPK